MPKNSLHDYCSRFIKTTVKQSGSRFYYVDFFAEFIDAILVLQFNEHEQIKKTFYNCLNKKLSFD